jgi:hypothetical protein
MKGTGGRRYAPAGLPSCRQLRVFDYFIALAPQCSEAMHIFDGGFMASRFLLYCLVYLGQAGDARPHRQSGGLKACNLLQFGNRAASRPGPVIDLHCHLLRARVTEARTFEHREQ